MSFHSRPLDAYKQTSFGSASKGTFMADAYGIYWKVTLGQGIPVILPLSGDHQVFQEIPSTILSEAPFEGLQPLINLPCIELPIGELRIAIGNISKKPSPFPWQPGTLGLTAENKFVVCIVATVGGILGGYLIEIPSGELYFTEGWSPSQWSSIAWINHWSLESAVPSTGKSEVLCAYDGRSLPFAE